MTLAARVEGIGLVGPGLAGWPHARAVLCGSAPYERTRTVHPLAGRASRRRAPPRRKGRPAFRWRLASRRPPLPGACARDMGAVFTSSTGDGENVHAICEMLASNDRMISPTRFHNSVHNAPSGYWSIATGSQKSADSLAAFDASFGAGMMEALSRLAADPDEPVLLIAYDAPYPEPLNATRPIPDAFAVALALSSPQRSRRGATITLEPGGTVNRCSRRFAARGFAAWHSCSAFFAAASSARLGGRGTSNARLSRRPAADGTLLVIAAPLDRTWLLANLPHQGAMSLLDAIVEWDDSCVRAVARNQRALDHPLRRGGELPSVCGIEYGAQAAAAHGALVSRTPSGAGVLASVRNVVMHADRLDDVPGDLDVLAERLGGDESGVLYRFEVASAGRVLVEGRVAVAFRR